MTRGENTAAQVAPAEAASGTQRRSPQGGRLVLGICDAVLCLALASLCAYIAAGAFYVAPEVQADPLLLVVYPAAMLAALVATRRSGAMFVAGWVAFALVAACGLAWALATAGGSSPLADEEANATLFMLTVVVCTLAVFLLSRSAAGLVVLAIAVIIDVALVEFLYRHGYLVASALALCALASLFMFSKMRIAHEKSGGAQTGARGGPLKMALLCVAAGVFAAGLAAGVSVALIAALNPPTGSIKLFTEERALEEIEVEGLADITQVPDEDLTSDLLDSELDSSKLGEQDSMASGDARSNPSPTAAFGSMLQSTFSMDTSSTDFNLITHEMLRNLLIIALALLLCAIAAVLIGKRLLRRRWLAAYEALPANEQAIAAFGKVQKCLGAVGLGRNEAETVAEYGARNESALRAFFGPVDNEPDMSGVYAELAQAFEQSRYGAAAAGEQDAGLFADLYRSFPKRAARHLGRLRYLTRFLRI